MRGYVFILILVARTIDILNHSVFHLTFVGSKLDQNGFFKLE